MTLSGPLWLHTTERPPRASRDRVDRTRVSLREGKSPPRIRGRLFPHTHFLGPGQDSDGIPSKREKVLPEFGEDFYHNSLKRSSADHDWKTLRLRGAHFLACMARLGACPRQHMRSFPERNTTAVRRGVRRLWQVIEPREELMHQHHHRTLDCRAHMRDGAQCPTSPLEGPACTSVDVLRVRPHCKSSCGNGVQSMPAGAAMAVPCRN
jgi:hypothetical protein